MFADLFSHVHEAVAQYGYVAVTLGIFLEDFGLPTPGETLLITGAIFASQGALNIWLLLFLAWVGGVVGDNIGYIIGLKGGHRLMIRYGGRIGLTEERFKKVEGFFSRYGDFVIVFARFVAILRQLNGIVAGTLEMPWWRFLVFNALGCALWVGFWGMLAYTLGSRFHELAAMVNEYRPYAYVAVAILILAGIFYWFWRRQARKKI